MKRNCDVCKREYEAQRASSKTCSTNCRIQKSRGGIVVDLGTSEAPSVPLDSTVSRVTAELDRVGRLETWRGAAAVRLAVRIDNAEAVMGFAALVKQLEATMESALAGTQQRESDFLDELKAKRDAKLTG